MPDPTRYWFPAKRYGWGWGPPTAWQGWVVMAAFGGLELLLAVRFLPAQVSTFLVGSVILTAGLLAICLVKGEPPAWRWGGPK